MFRLPATLLQAPHLPRVCYEGQTLIAYSQARGGERAECFFQEHCIVAVLAGHKTVHLPGGTAQVLPAGSVALLRKGCYTLSEKEPAADEPFRSLLFFLSDRQLRQFAQQHADLLPAPPAAATPPLLLFAPCPALAQFYASLEVLFSPAAPRPAVLAHLLPLKYQELLLLLLSLDGTRALAQLLHEVARGQRPGLEALLNAHYTRRLSVPELASLAGRSVAAFKRDVRAEFGVYPGQWLTRKRLERARFLLAHSTRTVAEVADAVGFDSPSAFIRAYKRAYGTTPRAARRAEMATG